MNSPGGAVEHSGEADDQRSCTLRPRPEPDPLVVALVATAVDQVWPRPLAPPDEADPAHLAWRFSGRWWNKPTAVRRERPWTQR